MATTKPSANKILDTAIELAEKHSWEQTTLPTIAAALNTDLVSIYKHYQNKDDLTNAYFLHADHAMLMAAKKPDFLKLSRHKKLHHAIMAWLDSFQDKKHLIREMLCNKLQPGHIATQVHTLNSLHTTVQWLRAAVDMKAQHSKRILEEAALAKILLLTLSHWLYDHSKDNKETEKLLTQLLNRAESLHFAIELWFYEPTRKFMKKFNKQKKYHDKKNPGHPTT